MHVETISLRPEPMLLAYFSFIHGSGALVIVGSRARTYCIRHCLVMAHPSALTHSPAPCGGDVQHNIARRHFDRGMHTITKFVAQQMLA